MRTLAEMVETPAAEDAVRRAGVDYAPGAGSAPVKSAWTRGDDASRLAPPGHGRARRAQRRVPPGHLTS